jgi:phenylacetate-CoA ligase
MMFRPPRGLVRRFFFPLHERLRGRATPELISLFAAHDDGEPSQLSHWHEERLVRHLRRAVDAVPFYRRHVGPGSVRDPSDLARFPLLDKALIRSEAAALRAEDWRGRTIALETGGSTGAPLRFLSDALREASQLACKWRARRWHGLHPGHRECAIWGSPLEAARGGALRRLSARLLGYELLPAFAISDAAMAGWKERLRRQGADLVYGYASVLARYARWLERRGESLGGIGLRLAVSTAEVLAPADREVIARVFGAPVADEYGCRDGGLIAHECERGGRHLMHDAVHVEILDDNGRPQAPGSVGEVCVTNLWAQAFPLIRYRLGDRMALLPERCACGRGHPLAGALEGRITDTLVRTDGVRVHGLALIYILRETRGVDRFRVEQDAVGELRILIVPAPDFDAVGAPLEVARRSRCVLGEATRVQVEIVPDLEPLASGKHRYVICRVAEGGPTPADKTAEPMRAPPAEGQ